MGRIPLYYEYKDMNTTFSKTIKGAYLDNYKDLFDLCSVKYVIILLWIPLFI